MAKLTDDDMQAALQPYLQGDEELRHWAFGVKQPNVFLILFLFLLAILPGAIAVILLTQNYLVGLTEKRFLVLQVKGMGNATVKHIAEYSLDDLRGMTVRTSTGRVFTNICIDDVDSPFVAKFHRLFSKNNRLNAIAIGEAITSSHTN